MVNRSNIVLLLVSTLLTLLVGGMVLTTALHPYRYPSSATSSMTPSPSASSQNSSGRSSTEHASNSTSTSGNSSTQVSRSTSRVGLRNNISILSPTGLRLELSINSTEIHAGETINATVALSNTLTVPNNISAASEWPIKGLSVGPCGVLNYPYGMAVFEGYFVLSNISSAKQLQLYAPGIYNCPGILSGIDGYVFDPQSDRATVYGSCEPRSCFTLAMRSMMPLKGFWSPPLAAAATFNDFTRGMFTVVAGDEWGDMVILHFSVTPSQAEPIQVVSVIGPIEHLNPAGPVISLTFRNEANTPVTSLYAMLRLVHPPYVTDGIYTFEFNVSESMPLLPRQMASETKTMIGGGFDNALSYPLTIHATLRNGTDIVYTEQVRISEPWLTLSKCSNAVEVNGTRYCSLDVTGETEFGVYSSFVNGPITFRGVNFATYCAPQFPACPNPTNASVQTSTATGLLAIRLNMTFPDNTVETVGTVWGTLRVGNTSLWSEHINPRAGVIVEGVEVGSVFQLRVILLVQESPSLPFNYPTYLTASTTCGYAFGNGTSGPAPCFGGLSEAHVFNCASSAASPTGCTQVVASSLIPNWKYTINIRYPYVNQKNEPSWANCVYSVVGTTYVSQYAYCIAISPTTFILSTPGPPPP